MDFPLSAGVRSAALHAGLLPAGQTDLVVVCPVVTGGQGTRGHAGLVAAPRLALQSCSRILEYLHKVANGLQRLTADCPGPPSCRHPGLQTGLSVGADCSAQTLAVPAHVTAARVVNTLRSRCLSPLLGHFEASEFHLELAKSI